MKGFLKIAISPLIKSQIRLYVFLGIILGLYQLILLIKYQELEMFGFGMIKGTIIGLSIGVIAGLALKEMCNKKRTSKSNKLDEKV